MEFKKLFWILLIVTFLKELVFSALVPIWHTPDEQAHFAQVAYFAEFNKMPVSGNDLNNEIYQSENLLGTLRDKNGDNKFTFHPEYKIAYTQNYTGKYEEEIKNFPESFRTELVKQEAANYPPLYYVIDAGFYKLFYNFDLISRVYASRFFSVILGVLLVFFAGLIGKEVFPKNEALQLTLPIFVSFQPMISFVSSGVNSDNLMNTLFTSFIYLCVLLIKKGANLKVFILIVFNILLLYFTKPQFIYAFPILLVALIFFIKNLKKAAVFSGAIIFLIAIFYIFQNDIVNFLKGKTYLFSFYPGYPGYIVDHTLTPIQYIKNTLTHTYAEVMPWYWGVFDWLSVTLPHIVNRIINYAVLIAIVGFLLKMLNFIRIRKIKRDDLLILFMAIAVLIYFGGISYYDYLFILGHGFSFGIQGRYFFPTIAPEMVVLLAGLTFLIPSKYKNAKEWFIKGLGLAMVLLNFIALFTIARVYYDISNLNTFITQASQYKPGIIKGVGLEFLISLYIISLGFFIFMFLKRNFLKPA